MPEPLVPAPRPPLPSLPAGLVLVRRTPEFRAATTPAGLLRAHRVAAGVWGLLRVLDGHVRFVFEDAPATTHDLRAGDAIVIPPDVAHRVEPTDGCRFLVEFHAPAADPASVSGSPSDAPVPPAPG